MFMRTQKSRQDLVAALTEKQTPGCWNHIQSSAGLYCLLGVTKPQFHYLEKKHDVYLGRYGRLNVTALNENNLAKVVDAIDDTFRNCV